MKMNEVIKAEWVALLREGGLKQTDGELYNTVTDSYCCLGVLCEIAVGHGISLKKDSMYKTKYKKDCNDLVLPEGISEWAGLKGDNDPKAKHYKRSLAGLNDNGKTFSQIADIIEKGL